MTIFRTHFDHIPPTLARGMIVLLVAIVAYGLVAGRAAKISDGPQRSSSMTAQAGDLVLYNAILTRVSHGDSYYAVAADELRRGGYPLRPVWNFRLPTLAVALSWFPNDHARRLFLQITVIAVCAAWTIRFLRMGASPLVAMAGFACIASSLIGPAAADRSFLLHEVWASLAIALALALHGRRTWLLSVVLGLVAVLLRELSLPFLFVMLATAFWERQRVEAGVWLSAIVLFGAVLLVHARLAAPHMTGELVHSWVRFGGWSFILSTAQWNAILLFSPNWVSAVLVPIALLGLIGWKSAIGTRAALTVTAYVSAFLVVGRPDNHYWGMIYIPLLSLGWLSVLPTMIQIGVAALPRPADEILNA